jgi:hypothetical protein
MSINTTAKNQRRIKNRKILAQSNVNNEPIIENQETDLGTALSWYSVNSNPKDQKQYTLEYFNQADPKIANELKKLEDWNFQTFGSICRLMTREMYDPKSSTSKWFDNKLDELLQRAAKKVEVLKVVAQVKPVVTIQERIYNAASDIAGEFDEQIDLFTTSGYKSDFSPKDFLSKAGVSAPVAKRVGEFFLPVRDELKDAYDGVDEQLIEGYSHISRRDLKRFIKFMEDICSSCDQQVQNSKATRTPRKRKPLSPMKVVARVKFQREFDELKLKSIKPMDMVNTTEIWVYNTKYKKIVRYTNNDVLGIKGTTIVGFDVDNSKQWTLRKPEEFFKGLAMGKRALNNAIKSIKTKPTTPNGRLNENCVLLGAF